MVRNSGKTEGEIDITKGAVKTNLLGQILVKKGLLTKEQLQEALNIQKREKFILLGNILVKMGYLTEEKLSLALASQTDLSYLPVEKYKISQEVLKIVPKDLARKYSFIPLEKIGSVLTVVMANPFDKRTISEVEAAIHHKVVCLVGTKTQIEKAITVLY